MSIVKALRFPASAHWHGGRLTRVSAPGKASFEWLHHPSSRAGSRESGAPRSCFVAAAGSCFAGTLAAFAEPSGVELDAVEVEGIGHVERRNEGGFGFVAVELMVEVAARKRIPSH